MKNFSVFFISIFKMQYKEIINGGGGAKVTQSEMRAKLRF